MASDDSDQDTRYALSKILQRKTVAEYESEFLMLIKRVTGNSESLLKSFYISGLKSVLQCALLRLGPTILGEAFSIARIMEARFETIAWKKYIEKKIDTILSWSSEEAPPVIKGSLDASKDTTLSFPSEEVSLVVEGPLEASKDNILLSALNVAPLEVVFAGQMMRKLLPWQGDLFATGDTTQVDTWNHNRPHPVNTFKWRSGLVHCNLGEQNILAAYGNDMGITNYGLRLKDETIKKLKERTQMSKKRLKIWDPGIKNFFF
nr:hypothetical protein [Tanacetum cinerariifolium]